MHRQSLRFFLFATSVVSLAITGWILSRVAGHAPLPVVQPPTSGVFRIYVLGGSTAAGAPYTPRCDVGQLVAYLFDGELAGRRIEATNLAGSGDDTARALKCARDIARVPHEADSAIAVLYSGDNEFLKFVDPLRSNPGQRRLFDVPLVPPEKRAEVLRDYAAVVEEIAHALERAGVPLVVCTGATNIADREPNRSVLDDARNESVVRETLDRAEAAFTEGEFPAALAELDLALATEPHFAWTHKRRGDVLRKLSRIDEARAAFQAAINFDQAPISFTSQQNESLRALAQKLGLALVDGEALVRAASKDGLPGYDLFWDNCHPRMEGFLCLASGVAGVLEERFHVKRKRANPSTAEVESAFRIDGDFATEMLIGRGQYMYGIALLTWNPSQRLACAHRYLDEAARRAPGNAALACSRAVLALIEGDLEESRIQWRAAFAADAAMARLRLHHPSVLWLLHALGVEDPQSVFGP